MTADELITQLNNEFGLNTWPETYDVDAETYANAVNYAFERKAFFIKTLLERGRPINYVGVLIGPNKRLMFKNVELMIVAKH
jgi:hypothetical protein